MIHPIAKILKPLFEADYWGEPFEEAILDPFFRNNCYFGCYICHKIVYKAHIYRKDKKTFCHICYHYNATS